MPLFPSSFYPATLAFSTNMAPQKRALPGWNARTVDSDKILKDELDAAERTAVRPNLRVRMATLQDVPMETASISFHGSLKEWIDCCLSPLNRQPEGEPAATSSALIRRPSLAVAPAQASRGRCTALQPSD